MKKILLLFRENYTQHVIELATSIASANGAVLYGIFVSTTQEGTHFNYFFPNDMALTEPEPMKEEDAAETKVLTGTSVRLFEESCSNTGVRSKVVMWENATTAEISEWGAYADLIICDADLDSNGLSLNDILTQLHCPVVLVPVGVTAVQKVVLAYDGSYGSMHAIKLFAYLFAQWRQLPVQVVSVLDERNDVMKNEAQLKDWIAHHFENVQLTALTGKPEEALVRFVQSGEEGTMVVMGSFGRSQLSRLFKESLSYAVLKNSKAAVFIAHL